MPLQGFCAAWEFVCFQLFIPKKANVFAHLHNSKQSCIMCLVRELAGWAVKGLKFACFTIISFILPLSIASGLRCDCIVNVVKPFAN